MAATAGNSLLLTAAAQQQQQQLATNKPIVHVEPASPTISDDSDNYNNKKKAASVGAGAAMAGSNPADSSPDCDSVSNGGDEVVLGKLSVAINSDTGGGGGGSSRGMQETSMSPHSPHASEFSQSSPMASNSSQEKSVYLFINL